MSITPHAILEVRNGAGDLIWRFDRDGKKSVEVIPPQVARDLNVMMNKVVEEGTGKRAILDNTKSAGKTGTTNAYRDAWFVGFTGNYIAGVWFGNDDYTSTNRMTGGSLPAGTWHDIMAYAHQGIEIKAIPGVPNPAPTRQTVAASAKGNDTQRPSLLTRRGADILVRVERLMDEATRALVSNERPAVRADAATSIPQPIDAFASAADRRPPGPGRGN
jgi:penicillin-binding protein 1A